MVTENYVAGELVKHGVALNYYDRKSKHELDFVFQEKGKITVLEVKSGKDYKQHTSLDMAQSLFADSINRRIVMSGNNVEVGEDGVVYLPLYMSMFSSLSSAKILNKKDSAKSLAESFLFCL